MYYYVVTFVTKEMTLVMGVYDSLTRAEQAVEKMKREDENDSVVTDGYYYSIGEFQLNS